MARASSAKNRSAIEQVGIDLIGQFRAAMDTKRPWDSIIDFATHPSFSGLRLYPRQQTLLKLIYLETENMTAYDIEVIEGWRQGFKDPRTPAGVQEDIWERVDFLKANGYTHFPHVQSILGRRASKGMIGGVLGAERLAFMVSLDNPQEHYGIAEGKEMFLHVVATNQDQAKKFLFADVRQAVEQNQWLAQRLAVSKEYRLALRTPNDLRRIADMSSRGLPVDREIASIQAVAMSSNSSSGRGGSAFANLFDEFAHMINGTNGPQTSEAVYSAYQPALDQLGRDALTYIPSSPLTKVGKFYELYTQGRVLLPEYLQKEKAGRAKVYDQDDLADELEKFEDELYANPELLVVQLPSWELYKDWERGRELVGVPFKRAIQYEPDENGAIENKRMFIMEKQDPDSFKVERRAQFAEVVGAYLDPEKVDDIFRPFRLKENEPLRVLERKDNGRVGFMYHGHVDPSKSGANFAVAIGHLEKSEIPDEHGSYWNHVVFDFLHVYQPHHFDNHTVDYVQIEKDLERLIGKYRSLDVFSFDQWNSVGFIHKLREVVRKLGTRTSINEVTFSHTRNKRVAEQFKTALNLGWVHAYRDDFFDDGEGSLLEMELKFLTEKNGKIEKQNIGPVTTKDLADCVMEVTVSLLESQFGATNDLRTVPVMGAQGGYPTRSALNPNAGRFRSPGEDNVRDRLSSFRSGGRANNSLRSRGRRLR